MVASLAAYFIGEFSNSYVLARMKILTQGRWVWSRTIGSTLVGEAVDSIAFITIATAFGVFPPDLLLSLILTNYILKVGIEVIMTPITLLVIRWLKRAEREDYYDTDTDFNPFKLESLTIAIDFITQGKGFGRWIRCKNNGTGSVDNQTFTMSIETSSNHFLNAPALDANSRYEYRHFSYNGAYLTKFIRAGCAYNQSYNCRGYSSHD